ncbi:MAG: cytochrome c [Pseudomonadota bacterium]|nr:cytochrome c [Pseudomonadota bacterium]
MNKRATAYLLMIAGLASFGRVLADTEKEQSIDRGAGHFRIFCTNCHGVNADGKGPLVKLLKVEPTDLTILRQTGGGESVTERVLKAVSGRHEVGEGQEQKMPVFSDNLEVSTVYEIAEYLESIQK